ncbi:acylphosphatase [Falsiroseomonas sp. E2-1-a20]|uniref:acylphosphatase n=1 Tax=Falsiroseomonas sp. E2-1-a20 TaxID=3239300 RepID=UPI003F3D81B7
MTALLLAITGRVQAVGYRDWLVREAQRQGVQGWVRNRPDGSVQALVAGEAEAVRALVAACRRGPLFARVTQVAESPHPPPEEPGFRRMADD